MFDDFIAFLFALNIAFIDELCFINYYKYYVEKSKIALDRVAPATNSNMPTTESHTIHYVNTRAVSRRSIN